VALLVGLWIIPRAFRLGRDALRILVQAAPAGMDLDDLHAELAGIDGVTDVHDLHVWTLTSEMEVATVHLMTSEGTDPHPVLDKAREVLRDRHGVDHATLQVEPDSHRGCIEESW
jgi:cobalt-zinc-cadmium efflux system protein